MRSRSRPWLPSGTVPPPALDKALADMVALWSRKWFALDELRPVGALTRHANRGRPLRIARWHLLDEEVALGFADGDMTGLGALVLGVAPETTRRDADRELLEKIGGECADDLKRQLIEFLRLPPGQAWRTTDGIAALEPVWSIDLAGKGKAPHLHLEIGDARFTRLAKEHLPAARPGAAIGDAQSAVLALPLDLSALLGRCSLTVAELENLSCGDVLVLDGTTTAALPLAIEGALAPRGSAQVIRQDAGLALQIVHPVFP